MTDQQKNELKEYVSQTKGQGSYSDDACVIRDFIEAFGDDVTWENIDKLCASRRLGWGGKDTARRFLYRWKMWKEGVPVSVIASEQGARACGVAKCPDRDLYGFCLKRYRYWSSCPTLKQLNEIVKAPEPKKEEKPEKGKVDWIFGKVCSYKDAACAVFKGNY